MIMRPTRPTHRFIQRLSRCSIAAVLMSLLVACDHPPVPQATVAVDFSATDVCALTGLRPVDHPGPKGQIHYLGAQQPVFTCDTVELLHLLLAGQQPETIVAVMVQDTAQIDWFEPRGHWIDARSAVYVAQSGRLGPLGATLASFQHEQDAQAFITQHGGTLLRFSEIKPDHVVLDGGALHDSTM